MNWVEQAVYQRFPKLAGPAAQRFSRPDAQVEQADAAACAGRSAREGMEVLKRELLALKVSLPVLYRQYVDLVEPEAGGVRFLDFGVDPGFGNCVVGLIRVDLAWLRPGKRQRYIDIA